MTQSILKPASQLVVGETFKISSDPKQRKYKVVDLCENNDTHVTIGILLGNSRKSKNIKNDEMVEIISVPKKELPLK